MGKFTVNNTTVNSFIVNGTSVSAGYVNGTKIYPNSSGGISIFNIDNVNGPSISGITSELYMTCTSFGSPSGRIWILVDYTVTAGVPFTLSFIRYLNLYNDYYVDLRFLNTTNTNEQYWYEYKSVVARATATYTPSYTGKLYLTFGGMSGYHGTARIQDLSINGTSINLTL